MKDSGIDVECCRIEVFSMLRENNTGLPCGAHCLVVTAQVRGSQDPYDTGPGCLVRSAQQPECLICLVQKCATLGTSTLQSRSLPELKASHCPQIAVICLQRQVE